MSTATDSEALDEAPSNLHPLLQQAKAWLQEKGPWFATSLTAHAVILIAAALILNLLGVGILPKKADGPEFVAEAPPPAPEAQDFKLTNTSVDPTELNTESLTAPDTEATIEEKNISDAETFIDSGGGMKSNAAVKLGGLGGFEVKGLGAGGSMTGPGGVGGSDGFGKNSGTGGDGSGFGGRGQGHREAMVGQYGGTKNTERAVAAALNWFARHQSADGSWSLNEFNKNCKGAPCSNSSHFPSDSVATAFALLPFLAAGQTHVSKGPYQNTIRKGITWLITHQKPDGSLYINPSNAMMYVHGICTICLCECYGLSEDSTVGLAAQKAIDFIEASQDRSGGGWRYAPQMPGDTSVVGWQVMALKSGLMAGLKVKPETLKGAQTFLSFAELKNWNNNPYGGWYGYTGPGRGLRLTAIGSLCSQYLGKTRDDPALAEGVRFLMANMPDKGTRDCYYWYYGTQVLHNMLGPDWDSWNRKMRKILVDSQTKEGCASGSWDPDLPTKDPFGDQGGRIMTTSLSCLTLEIYYRYLPLYKLDQPDKAPRAEADEKSAKQVKVEK